MKVLYMDSRIEGYTDTGDPIYDRPTSGEDQRQINRAIVSNGVYPNPSTNLQVLQGSDDMTVFVMPGICSVEGAYGVEPLKRTLLVQASDANLDRIDRVVARVNFTSNARTLDLYIIPGAPAPSPIAPELTRNSTVYDICLAELYIGANTSTIPQYKISDTRGVSDLCGWMHGLVEQVDTSTIFNQYAAWLTHIQEDWVDWTAEKETEFNTWLDGVKTAWTTFFGDAQNDWETEQARWIAWWADQEKGGFFTEDGTYEGLTTTDKHIVGAINEINTGTPKLVGVLLQGEWDPNGDSYSQTIPVSGLEVGAWIYIVSANPDDGSLSAYGSAGVEPRTPTTGGTAVFVAASVPTQDINVYFVKMKEGIQ